MVEFTTNYSLAKPDFNISPWHDEVNANFDIIDTLIFAFTGVGNVKGEWANSTAYTAGDRVVDPADASLWQCQVSHTSAAAPTTFAADRTANPTYWTSISQNFGAAVTWQTGTAYTINQFLIDGTRYGVATANYTSGASYNADVTAGNIITLIDLAGYQPADTDLTALAALATTGMMARTGAAAYTMRTITGPAAGITVSNGNGVSGNPTLALANDLAALEGMAGTGLVTRTAADTYAQRTITGTAGQILVTNGNGVSGNPVLSLDPAAINPAVFPSGTKMVFNHTAAPTGWTKELLHNNKAMRLTTGTTTTGGTVAFDVAFTSFTASGTIANSTATGSISGTALTTAQLPSHTHGVGTLVTASAGNHSHSIETNSIFGGGSLEAATDSGTADGSMATTGSVGAHTHALSGATAAAGSGSTHTHTFTGDAHTHTFTGNAINVDVQFVDFIIATKD